MHVVVIDSKNRKVTDLEVHGDTLEMLQGIVGGSIEPATQLGNKDTVYVNEEGLLIGLEDFFEIEGGHQPFAGTGVIVGRDSKGRVTSAKTSAEDAERLVTFVHRDHLIARYSRSNPRRSRTSQSHS